MKKITALLLILMMLISMSACQTGKEDGKYVVGICQIQAHEALDAATQGFQDALIAELGEENVKFKHQDAGGDYNNCGTIMAGSRMDAAVSSVVMNP